MKVIDASNHVLGRLASKIAKELLEGQDIVVVNAEKCVVSGNPKFVFEHYKKKIDRGHPYTGPFFPRRPDMLFKRTVRGMLPIKKPKGRAAYRKLIVYVSVPAEYAKMTAKRYKNAENKLNSKYITLEDLARKLGVKM